MTVVGAGVARATDILVDSIHSSFASGDGIAPPTVVLWPDGDGQWSDLVTRLRGESPWLFTLGDYDPDRRTGPAIWLRCIVDRTLPHIWPVEATTPILYLPQVERQQLRAGGDCPPELQPLIELQYRGVTWHQRNGRDWTVDAFLTSTDGCDLEIAKDQLTRLAMLRVLPRLADVPLDALRGRRLTAEDFDKLAVPDAQRDLLLWLHDPSSFRLTHTDSDWIAFCNLVKIKYGMDPEENGPSEGARLLLDGAGQWAQLWQRFSEAPQRYRGISKLLRDPLPGQGILVDRAKLPLENADAEDKLRAELGRVGTMPPAKACDAVLELESEHGMRRAWVWRYLDESPLAVVLQPLARIAEVAKRNLLGVNIDDIATAYTSNGWRCDEAALAALALTNGSVQHDLVCGVLRAIYLPWLDQVCRQFQTAVEQVGTLPTHATPTADPGTCLLFADGLRFDMGARLQAELEGRGVVARLSHRIGPVPSVTATAKPLATTVPDSIEGDSATDFTPRFKDTKQPTSAERLRDRMAGRGVEVLDAGEIRIPSRDGAIGWIEVGRIDELGHKLGEDLSKSLDHEIDRIRDTILALLSAGWNRVRVVTDHGWLFMPGGLPKIELPHYLVGSRWARCAAVREGATPQIQTLPWFWNTDVRIASPIGAGAYTAGTRYTHGGVSPQECIVPELTVDRGAETTIATINAVEWKRLRCVVTVVSNKPWLRVDVRTNWKQSGTSIVLAPKAVDDTGSVSLAVRDDFEGQSVMVVVLDATDNVLDKRSTTVGGD